MPATKLAEARIGEIFAVARTVVRQALIRLSRFPARQLITNTVALSPGAWVDIRRRLLAESLKPLAGRAPRVQAVQRHGQAIFGEPTPERGTPLYTDVRRYGEHGVPAVRS